MKNEEKLNNIYMKCRENKNSHVYLVETNSILMALEDIKKLIIKICGNDNDNDNNISYLVENDALPTLSIIKPDKQEIKIDAIDELINKLQKVPVITKENYFIICDAEKLNHKSGNSMLKIIEEPDSDILGFFICLNANNVMQTIQSRSQYIKLSYEIKKDYDNELVKDSEQFVDYIYNNQNISFNKYFVDKYKDIDNMCQFIDCTIDIIRKNNEEQNNFDIIKKENKVIKLLVELESNIRINGNPNLLFDKFLLEVGRLK